MEFNEKQSQSGEFLIQIFRGDGQVEIQSAKNLFVNEGMNWLAAYQSTSPGSAMNHMLVGTGTAVATLTDVNTTFGEVDRNTMATRTAAANILTEVCTFAGGLDGITSLRIREIGVTNDARSGGFGSLRSRSGGNQVDFTLAASDFVNVSYQTTCGSR